MIFFTTCKCHWDYFGEFCHLFFHNFFYVGVESIDIGVCSEDDVLVLGCHLFFEIICELCHQVLFDSVFNLSFNLLMLYFLAFGFFFWLLIAFWIASMVSTKAELTSQNPNCFCYSFDGGNVSSNFFRYEIKITKKLWILCGLLINWW